MALSELYQKTILEHNRSPCNHFRLDDATHCARGLDALCGDDLRVWLRVEKDRIVEASWSGHACVITTASASMLMKWLVGRTRAEVREAFERFRQLLDHPEWEDQPELGHFNCLKSVGRFPSRKRNALLPWSTTLEALDSGRRSEFAPETK